MSLHSSTHQQAAEDIDAQIIALLADEQTLDRGFSLLVKTYQERLYWHLRGMFECHEDADEVLQNSFIKVYKGFHNFQGNSKLYTWLYRIATNEAITYMNKQKKHRAVAFDDSENGIANQLEADAYFDSEALQILLKEAIDALPEKQKEVFEMRYLEELSYQEISEKVGTSVGGLKASYHHAVKKIEEYIKSKL